MPDFKKLPTNAGDVGEADPLLHGYLVTVVCSATEPSNLMGATNLPGGVTIHIEEGRFLLRIPVRAPDGRTALQTARGLAEDFCRVLATTYSPFRIDYRDDRDNVTRSDPTPVTEGPIPFADVAEGHISAEGLTWLDPDGDGRRAGKVFRVRGSGVATRSIDECGLGFAQREAWSPRLRNAMSLYWAAQCSPDRQIRFVLAMASLEVLAQPPTETLLKVRLDRAMRKQLKSDIQGVLEKYLSPADVDRVLSRVAETRAVGAIPTLSAYINTRIAEGSQDFGGRVTEDEVRSWVGQRGGFLHNGPHDPSDELSRARLDALVGAMLRWELDNAGETESGTSIGAI